MSLLAAAAAAQCAVPSVVGAAIVTGDDNISALQPLGFAFPMAGAAVVAGGYTHCHVGTNGWIFLTNSAGLTTGRPLGGDYGSTAASAAGLRGLATHQPLLAACWGDLEVDAPAGGVYIDSTSNPGVSCKISWVHANTWTSGTPLAYFDFTAELFATGEVRYSYSAGMNPVATKYIAVSARNNVALPTASNLVPGPASVTGGLIYEQFGTFDAGGTTISFVPAGADWNSSVTCQGAFNKTYGTGCYGPVAKDTFYQLFATPAAASAALVGQSMVLTPAGNGYTASWGGGTYVVPSGGATLLTQTDDSNAAVTPSIPFPHVSGPIPTLAVASNGYVSMGPINVNSVTAYANVANLRNDTLASFRSNIDYDFTAATSPLGACKSEEVVVGPDTILYVTYENVERYQAGATSGNSDRVQFQFNLTTGVVTIVWDAVQGITGTGTAAGTLVGYSAAGASFDPGSINLATALPVTTSPDINLSALSLSASPAPVYTIGGSTAPITYTINNAIDVAPPAGVGLNVLIFSLNQLPLGIDLGPAGIDVGAGGCSLYVGSLDVTLSPSSTAPTSTLTLAIPQPLSPGLSFYLQAISLFASNSLPNGQNALGVIFSNGLQQYFNTF